LDTGFSSTEIKRLYQQFRTIANKQNLLDQTGFRESMGVLGMVQDSILCQRLFSVFNTNQTGFITFGEYARGLNTLIKGTVDEKLTFAFAMTDLDGSGEITPEELEITVDSIMRIYSGIMGSANTGLLDRNKIRRMFNKLDRDKNGLITLDEYIRGMKAHPDFVSNLRGSDLFAVGQNNVIKQERAKAKQFHKIGKLLELELERALVLVSDLEELDTPISVSNDSDEDTIFDSEEESVLNDDLFIDFQKPVNSTLVELKSLIIRMKRRIVSITEEGDPKRGSFDHHSSCLHSDSAYDNHKKPMGSEVLNLNEMSEFISGSEFEPLSPDDRDETGALEKALAPASKGSTVFFGHESWDLVVNVMKGIQMAVGRSAAEAERPLNMFDFSVKEKYTLFAGTRLGKSARINSSLPDNDLAGKSCRFVDYAPLVFCKLREHFGIKNEDYVHSIGPGNMLSNLMLGSLSSLNELGSEGKSGSFFYFTSDGLFMVKTIHKEEHKLLRHILNNYYYHMTGGSESTEAVDSLLCRIVGCHVIRLSKNSKIGAEKIYFVVMTNMLHTDLDLKRRYDLKGSSVGRKCNEESRLNPKATLKDLDFTECGMKISIGPDRKEKLMRILERDASFLESKHIIDYSLLLGVADGSKGLNTSSSSSWAAHLSSSRSMSESSCSAADEEEDFYVPFFQEHQGGMRSSDESQVYVMGVIDFLTMYTSRKRAERLGKTYFLLQNKDGISVQNPQRYKDRFINFMDKVIE